MRKVGKGLCDALGWGWEAMEERGLKEGLWRPLEVSSEFPMEGVI